MHGHGHHRAHHHSRQRRSEGIAQPAQHTAGRTLLESIELGDLPGLGMVIIDGVVRLQRSRNTPPATAVPEVL